MRHVFLKWKSFRLKKNYRSLLSVYTKTDFSHHFVGENCGFTPAFTSVNHCK